MISISTGSSIHSTFLNNDPYICLSSLFRQAPTPTESAFIYFIPTYVRFRIRSIPIYHPSSSSRVPVLNDLSSVRPPHTPMQQLVSKTNCKKGARLGRSQPQLSKPTSTSSPHTVYLNNPVGISVSKWTATDEVHNIIPSQVEIQLK